MNNSELSKLISLVLRHRCIYDRKHWRHSKRNHRDKIWLRISDQMRRSEKLCRAMWNRLKDKYRREKKKIEKQMLNGATRIKESSWKYFDDMKFIECPMTFEKEKEPSAIEESVSLSEAGGNGNDVVELLDEDEAENMALSLLVKRPRTSAEVPCKSPEDPGSSARLPLPSTRFSCNNSPAVSPVENHVEENGKAADAIDRELLKEMKLIREAYSKAEIDDNTHFLLSLRGYMCSLTPTDRMAFRCATQKILGRLMSPGSPSSPNSSNNNSPLPNFQMYSSFHPSQFPGYDAFHPDSSE